jgi:hypothetical protein
MEKHGLEIVFPWEMAFTSRQMEVRTGRTWDYLNLTELVLLSLIQRIAILFGLVFLPCGDSDERGVYKTTDGEPLGTSSL